MNRNFMDDNWEENEESGRRILIYMLLDISSSMRGAPIDAVNEGIDLMISALKKSPEALQMAHLCFITFGSNAQVVLPLTPIGRATPPILTASGKTNMTAAIELVDKQITQDFRPSFAGQAVGDYRPLIFMLTDGMPNSLSSAETAANNLRNRPSGHGIGTFMALGCGAHAKREALEKITQPVGMMVEMTEENITKFFQWVSATVKGASERASNAGDAGGDQAISPPPIPKDEDDMPIWTF